MENIPCCSLGKWAIQVLIWNATRGSMAEETPIKCKSPSFWLKILLVLAEGLVFSGLNQGLEKRDRQRR